MKPLYVDGAQTRVALDGPALRISMPCSADRWFPLGRLSGVVSSCHVDWETAALLACAEQGVSVSFLDIGGELIARCIGRVNAHESLHERLESFLLQDDWPSLYAQWLAAVENMALRSVIRFSGLHFSQFPDARAMRRLFRQGAVSIDAVFAYERIGQEIHSLLVILATQMLANSQVDVGRFNAPDFNPAADMANILFWDFQLGRLRWLENRLERLETIEAPARAEIVEFFESRRQRTEKLARGLVRRLHRWLIELD